LHTALNKLGSSGKHNKHPPPPAPVILQAIPLFLNVLILVIV